MTDKRFAFSQCRSYLEWYKCYDDLSNKSWIDGEERRRLEQENGDDRILAKWDFFYRPFHPVIGRPQKKLIRERQATIEACNAGTEQKKHHIQLLREQERKASINLAVWSPLFVLGAVLLFQVNEGLILVPLLLAYGPVRRFGRKRAQRRADLRESFHLIDEYQTKIRTSQEEIRLLEGEIASLVEQVPQPPDPKTIEDWFLDEIGRIELKCLSECLGETITRDNVKRYLKQDFGDARVCGILLDSWGFLQPLTQRGPFGKETTGLGRAKDDLGEKVATWQIGKDRNPIFRLMFLQFIFPLEKNLNICSLFYDFVTRKDYGKRFETFQYNHVSNYSIRELDPQRDTWTSVPALDSIVQSLAEKSFNALTIAVTSGNHFQCVLVDEGIVDSLNKHLANEEKLQQLQASLLSDDEVNELLHNDKMLVDQWKSEEKARIEEELKALVREQRELQWTNSRTSQAVLAQVRNSIEHYVHRVQEPA